MEATEEEFSSSDDDLILKDCYICVKKVFQLDALLDSELKTLSATLDRVAGNITSGTEMFCRFCCRCLLEMQKRFDVYDFAKDQKDTYEAYILKMMKKKSMTLFCNKYPENPVQQKKTVRTLSPVKANKAVAFPKNATLNYERTIHNGSDVEYVYNLVIPKENTTACGDLKNIESDAQSIIPDDDTVPQNIINILNNDLSDKVQSTEPTDDKFSNDVTVTCTTQSTPTAGLISILSQRTDVPRNKSQKRVSFGRMTTLLSDPDGKKRLKHSKINFEAKNPFPKENYNNKILRNGSTDEYTYSSSDEDLSDEDGPANCTTESDTDDEMESTTSVEIPEAENCNPMSSLNESNENCDPAISDEDLSIEDDPANCTTQSDTDDEMESTLSVEIPETENCNPMPSLNDSNENGPAISNEDSSGEDDLANYTTDNESDTDNAMESKLSDEIPVPTNNIPISSFNEINENAPTMNPLEGDEGNGIEIVFEAVTCIDNVTPENEESLSSNASSSTIVMELPTMDTQTQGEEESYKCTKCNRSVLTKRRLAAHMSRWHPKPFQCSICAKCFDLRSALDRHEARHKDESLFKCPECPQRFLTKYQLKRHFLVHSGEKRFECSVCSKRCSQKCNVEVHMKEVHGINATRFTCPKCGRAYRTERRLTRHLHLHREGNPFKCTLCQPVRVFPSGTELSRHKNTIHEFKCPECRNTFSSKSSLAIHSRLHEGKKPYKCPYCPRHFNSTYNMSQHAKGCQYKDVFA